MLREIFPKVYRSYEQDPWGTELEDFASWLQTMEYSLHSTRGHLFRLRTVLARMKDFRTSTVFTVIRLHEIFQSGFPLTQRVNFHATQCVYHRFLEVKGRLVNPAPCDRFEFIRLAYQQYLAELRGFAPSTIQQHGATMRDFLSQMLGGQQLLADLTHADIERYILYKSPRVKRQSMQHTVAHLRSFMRYCYDRGEIRSRLDQTIDTPRTYRGELPPRALDWEVVQEFLSLVNLESRTGQRDYAILHLMAHYGLRPSEIVALRCNSIDWKTKILHVEQSKTRSTLALPLTEQTLIVLNNYLSSRPASSKHCELFLRARCPAGALKRTAVKDLFEKWAKQSNLLKGYSAYSLRHSFAMRLLACGVGVKAIGDLLGHHSLESTCQYLRLDVNMLRQVALPVPNAEQIGGLR
jgi:integrase/recombinase XerD